MMKAVAGIVSFAWITTNVYADIKWIPIEPIHPHENFKPDSNKSKPQPANQLFENVKMIQQLLDKRSKGDLNPEKSKNWYAIDEMETD
jgi:hypothetical protein